MVDALTYSRNGDEKQARARAADARRFSQAADLANKADVIVLPFQ